MRENIHLIWAELILSELKSRGIVRFFIAPGRRSAPFCIMAERLGLDITSHFDERSLAFSALGAAPAALICTSGTAVANCMPAVVEAHERHAPLIVITADRPHERHGVGDWQAIDQVKIFGSFVRLAIDLPSPTEKIPAAFVLTQVGRLLSDGPTHLNCRLREPLMEEKEPVDSHYLDGIAFPWTSAPKISPMQGIVTAGQGGKEALVIAKRLGWPLFPCITSGLRTIDDPCIVHHFEEILDELSCDAVYHVGGKMVSKQWEIFLQTKRPALVGSGLFNPVYLRRHIACEGGKGALIPSLGQLKEHLVGALFKNLGGRGLFLGSSLSVRLAQKFAPVVGPVEILSNRGASGIDGAISSAFGFAKKIARGVVALMGDLTFLYDLNALALLKGAPYPITVVILNNRCGGIFSALPMPSGKKARALIETPQEARLEEAAHLFDVPYTTDLISGLKSGTSGIIEIFVETQQQIKDLKESCYEFSRNTL